MQVCEGTLAMDISLTYSADVASLYQTPASGYDSLSMPESKERYTKICTCQCLVAIAISNADLSLNQAMYCSTCGTRGKATQRTKNLLTDADAALASDLKKGQAPW